jgi:hypothetical protein
VSVKFSRDGRAFVAEKPGRIRAFASTTAATGSIIADLSPQVRARVRTLPGGAAARRALT